MSFNNLQDRIAKSLARQFADSTGNVTCPKCKRGIPVKMRQMKPGASMTCTCGAHIDFTGHDMVGEFERSLR
jgi:hypothetical protein